MTSNEEKSIQLQIEHPDTHSILYNSQKYQINFDLFKYSSKYFYERRYEIQENGDIDLTKYDPDDNISNFSPDEVIDFIKYIQVKPIKLTNNNVVALHYFGHKYGINQLINSTEEYINYHEDEIMLKFLKRKELLNLVDLNFYEDKISSNFSVYINNDDIISLDISTLYRILEKVNMSNDKELKTSSMKNFLMKVLDKHGQPASILFQFADIASFDDETLTLLLTKYSKNFEFEFITASVLNAFLMMKKEHLKYKEESSKKYESIEKELSEQKNNNDEIKAILERERQEYLKYEEESSKKYESIEKELNEQKDDNNKIKAILERERQEHLKYEEESNKKYESIEKELNEQKNNNDEIRAILERERQEHLKYEEESSKKYESIEKELNEQKNNNDEMNRELSKFKAENEQLQEKQKDEQKEHAELAQDLDKHKEQITSTSNPNKDQYYKLKTIQQTLESALLLILERLLDKSEVYVELFSEANFDQQKLLSDFHEIFLASKEAFVFGELINNFLVTRFTELLEEKMLNRIIAKPDKFTFGNAVKWNRFLTAFEIDNDIQMNTIHQAVNVFILIESISKTPPLASEVCPDISPALVSFFITHYKKDENIQNLPKPTKFNKEFKLEKAPKTFDYVPSKKTALTILALDNL